MVKFAILTIVKCAARGAHPYHRATGPGTFLPRSTWNSVPLNHGLSALQPLAPTIPLAVCLVLTTLHTSHEWNRKSLSFGDWLTLKCVPLLINTLRDGRRPAGLG